MVCRRCGREYDEGGGPACPSCGGLGLLKTSAILIAAGGAAGVYHSLKEVPKPLRTRLLKSTTGVNSGTILIADRRGRQQLLRGLLQSILGEHNVERRRARHLLRQSIAWLAVALILMALWLATPLGATG